MIGLNMLKLIVISFTSEHLVDILTKTVSKKIFCDSLVRLGICNIYAPYLGGVLELVTYGNKILRYKSLYLW